MAKGPRYNVPFRRRREGKTNYKKRRALILSKLPRFIVRLTNKHVLIQVAEAKPNGDYVLASASSMELKKLGLKGCFKNTPAAYLTGFLAGFKALKNNVKEAVLDIGLRKASKGAKVFAAMKGALDAGLKISCNEEILPEESRIKGEHIAAYAKSLTQEEYNKKFSRYLKDGLPPENLPSHFDEIKNRIIESFKALTAHQT
ncbi:50S ribosomal protein L18 [Candidatus Bathyarchaeota archaeon]|nr:50S ribosomal protein L18 [Candidatus Bathyarchaeota archaeon]